MYESHFGLEAPPFQLGPDPGFYFDSKGHHHALSYLRFGAYQGEGFIVVTGEIGAGKTTLVRTLLAELDTSKVVAAQIVSTQLEAGDLLRAILLAFGVSCAGQTKAQLIASLEAFLTLLVTRGQRALLIVDEAQNLSLEAVEEMRMLSNFQFGNHALLQSFLVGQPELRKLLQSRSMEQLRQRVIASCHLGPLDAQETRDYIVHRLTKVGWKGRPEFTVDSFDAIHAVTSGIPRRVNVLCNRLLLGAFLGEGEQISAASVREVAGDLQDEVGEPALVSPAATASGTRPAGKPELVVLPSAGEAQRARDPIDSPPAWPVFLVADSALDRLKMHTLARGMVSAGLAVTPALVASRGPAAGEGGASVADAAAADVVLEIDGEAGAGRLAQALMHIDARIAETEPLAMVVLGSGDAVLACCLAARRRGLPILRLDGGMRPAVPGPEDAENAALIDRLASQVICAGEQAAEALHQEGMAAKIVPCAGTLMAGVLDATRSAVPDAAEVLRGLGAAARDFDGRRMFAVCLLNPTKPAGELLSRVDTLFGLLQPRAPVLWFVDAATVEALASSGVVARLRRQGVTVCPVPQLLEVVALLARASFVVGEADSDIAELSTALGVPLLRLDAAGTNAGALIEAADDILKPGPALSGSRQGARAEPVIDAVVRWVEGLVAVPVSGRRADFGSAGGR